MSIVTKRLLDLMKQRGVSAYRLTKDLGLSNGLVSQWKRGLQDPKLNNLSKVADYFGVPITYFTDSNTTETKKDASEEAPREVEQRLMATIKDFEDEELEKLLEHADYIKFQRKR